MASGATPWLAFFSFSVAPDCSATSEGLLEEFGTSAGPSLPTSATSGAISVLELASQMLGWQRGSIHFLAS